MNSPQRLATLDYLFEVAKDWTTSHFAGAENSDFVFAAHRFELEDHTVQRRRLPRRSREANDPLSAIGRPPRPVVWARTETVPLLMETASGPLQFEQEMVEILGTDGDDVIAEAAFIVRIPGLLPCLGRFGAAL